MKTIFYSKDTQFELTDEEFEKAIQMFDLNKRVYIKRLNVSLSPLYIWAGQKPDSKDRKQNKDGQWCIRKFGQWYLEKDQDVRVNLAYYPELEGIENKKEIEAPSKFAKELKDKF